MKIGVIGAGAVGVGVCHYTLAFGSCSELVLIDQQIGKAEGEMMDFGHANSLTFSKNIRLRAGDDYSLLTDADIVVITAGAQIKEGQTRDDLAEINSRITVDIAQKIETVAPNAILLVVTNPCDIATYFITQNTGFPADRVISAGCIIDTARLMKLVSEKVDVDPKNVSGYILGEHGSHCFMPWGLVGVAGQPIDYYCQHNGFDAIDPQTLLEEVKQAGFEIFKRKHNTTHGIAASVFRMIQAITIDEYSILPVGTLLSGHYGLSDVVLSLPTIVNARGAHKVLEHPFSETETRELHDIAAALQKLIREVQAKTGLRGIS
ncbi:L-lactate dehydrogenase [Reinekea blandensis]|uniref:Lactate dehydrogenase n=1 Tax=Reinekea blandensis MED297 TaxID=314283 RepID=A4BB89_9GAMM|nr:L-lactate dehydrogenase [Reinekea blandensis]EAR10702.1 Lactate dehydrogenase [Reinekea sp. MED297] [Reinekea blandensis MED297]